MFQMFEAFAEESTDEVALTAIEILEYATYQSSLAKLGRSF